MIQVITTDNRSATMEIPLKTLARSTELEFNASTMWTRNNNERMNLVDLINLRLERPVKRVSDNVADAFSEINETLRKRSGVVADGTWFPLHALARDMTTANSAALASGRVSNSAAPSLLPTSGIVSGGATILSGIKGASLSLPYVDGANGGTAWHDESAAASSFEPSFALAAAVPKSISTELIVSRRLMQNSSVDLDELLRNELAQRFGAAIDAAALSGDGLLSPEGLLGRSDLDVLSLGADGAAMTHGDLAELEARVLARANGTMRSPAWLMGPKLTKKLRTTVKNTGSMVYEGADLLGRPVIHSIAVPENLVKGTATDCSALVFGDLAELHVAFWGPAALDLMIDGYTLAKDAKIRIVARAEVGIVARRIGAFAAVKDALTT